MRKLKVAWTYETRDEFKGSEIPSNPIVIEGILYGTSPKMNVFALDAATGRQLWRFDANNGNAPLNRLRHRGGVVTGDRVLFNYRNRLYALDRKTGKPIRTFGDTGWVNLRAGLGGPEEGLSVGRAARREHAHHGSTVPEALPSAPGDVRPSTSPPVRCAVELPHDPASRRARIQRSAHHRVAEVQIPRLRSG